jgi:alpha/beta superfamily hydrolase
MDWLQSQNPNASSCWVAGFSFGAWIAMQLLMRRPEIDGFVAASPPANMFDFTFLAPCPVSGLFVQGTHDEIVSMESVSELAQKLCQQGHVTVEAKYVKDADHFFTNKLDHVMHHTSQYLDQAFLEEGKSPLALSYS